MNFFSKQNRFKLFTMIWAFMYFNLFSFLVFALALSSFLTQYYAGTVPVQVLVSLELAIGIIPLALLLTYFLSYFFVKKKEAVVKFVPYLQSSIYGLLFTYFLLRLITYYLSNGSLFWGDFNLYLCSLGMVLFFSQFMYSLFRIAFHRAQKKAVENLQKEFKNAFNGADVYFDDKVKIEENKNDVKPKYQEKETIIDGDFTEIKKDD